MTYIKDAPAPGAHGGPLDVLGQEDATLRELKVQTLGPEHIAQAYPLIQAAAPGVPLAAWTAFARALLRQRGRPESGLLGVVSEQGYIAGLSSYRVAYDLVHGKSLAADHFVAIDLFDRRAVVHALADAIEAMARARHCGAVHTTLQDNNSGAAHRRSTASILADRGHEVEAVCLCKVLPTAAEDAGHRRKGEQGV